MTIDKNVPVLNSLRALAALSVCMFHYVCTVTGFISNSFVTSIFSYGHLGVQMFFVISGFIIPWSMYHSKYEISDFFTFTLKRLIRLEPPYMVSLMFAIAHTYLRAYGPHYNGTDITPTAKQIALHFGYLIPFFEGKKWIRPVYWTLAVEFQYYITIGLLFKFISSNKMWLRILVYVLFLSGPIWMRANFLPYHLPIFLLGISLCLYKTKIISLLEMYFTSIAAMVITAVYIDVPSMCFAGFTFFVILYFSNIKSAIGDFLGNISYSIYLFHSLTGMILLNYFAHSTTSPFVKFVLLIVAVAISIGASYIVYRLVEKPSKALSSRIKYKK